MTFPIFEKLGGPDAAIAVIVGQFGKPPTKFVQDKWRSKRRLPTKIALALADECQRRGISWTFEDFRLPDEVAA